jgi:hypothetical protein
MGRTEARSLTANVRLIAMLPYALDYNSIEYV